MKTCTISKSRSSDHPARLIYYTKVHSFLPRSTEYTTLDVMPNATHIPYRCNFCTKCPYMGAKLLSGQLTNSRGNINQLQIRSRDTQMDRLLCYTTVIKWTFGKLLGQCFIAYSKRVLVSVVKEIDGGRRKKLPGFKIQSNCYSRDLMISRISVQICPARNCICR
jgi:hypothetical protein